MGNGMSQEVPWRMYLDELVRRMSAAEGHHRGEAISTRKTVFSVQSRWRGQRCGIVMA